MRKGVWITIIFIALWSPVLADDLHVAFPANLPPWTIEESDSGITVEIIRKSLQFKGHTVQTNYLSLKQLNHVIDSDIDANAQVESLKMSGHYSAQILHFETSLISLQPNSLIIESINDLSHHRIVAFQNASGLFGIAFEAMTKNNPGYQEIANQERQVVRLYNGEIDCLLMDRQIFLYFRRITAMTNTSMPIRYHQIAGLTEKSPTFVVFKNKTLRNDFGLGFQQLKDSGEYNDIFYKYTP